MGELIELRPLTKYKCPHCGEEFGIVFVDEKGKPMKMELGQNWTCQCLKCGEYFDDQEEE